jgi:hypothetical protein
MLEDRLNEFYFRRDLNVLREDLEMRWKEFLLFDYHLKPVHHKMYWLYEKNLEFLLIVFVHNEYNYLKRYLKKRIK